jgi:hypothetical protein
MKQSAHLRLQRAHEAAELRAHILRRHARAAARDR